MNFIIASAFFLIALIYSSVGFGGGSSYTTLLVFAGIPLTIIPIISLVCNIIVVAGNSINFLRAKQFDVNLFWPLALFSIPFAYWGGSLKLDKELFLWILFFALIISGLKLVFDFKNTNKAFEIKPQSFFKLAPIGAGLGFVAGVTGIGGGIYLAPILYFMRAAPPKIIAATCSLFIFVNSISGLLGQLQKAYDFAAAEQFWLLPIAVLIGGQIGSRLLLKFLPNRYVSLITGILICLVAVQIGFKELF